MRRAEPKEGARRGSNPPHAGRVEPLLNPSQGTREGAPDRRTTPAPGSPAESSPVQKRFDELTEDERTMCSHVDNEHRPFAMYRIEPQSEDHRRGRRLHFACFACYRWLGSIGIEPIARERTELVVTPSPCGMPIVWEKEVPPEMPLGGSASFVPRRAVPAAERPAHGTGGSC